MNVNDRIQRRITELEAEREKFIIEAQARLMAYDTVLAELRKLAENEDDATPTD